MKPYSKAFMCVNSGRVQTSKGAVLLADRTVIRLGCHYGAAAIQIVDDWSGRKDPLL